jgi:hypothetical protein
MRDKVLDRWVLGEGSGLIAKDYGCDKSWIKQIVREARAKGDSRAVSHADAAAGSDKWRERFVRKFAGWEFRA